MNYRGNISRIHLEEEPPPSLEGVNSVARRVSPESFENNDSPPPRALGILVRVLTEGTSPRRQYTELSVHSRRECRKFLRKVAGRFTTPRSRLVLLCHQSKVPRSRLQRYCRHALAACNIYLEITSLKKRTVKKPYVLLYGIT